jgi:hypothetical protein
MLFVDSGADSDRIEVCLTTVVVFSRLKAVLQKNHPHLGAAR